MRGLMYARKSPANSHVNVHCLLAPSHRIKKAKQEIKDSNHLVIKIITPINNYIYETFIQ